MPDQRRRKSLIIFRPKTELAVPLASPTTTPDLRSDESPIDSENTSPQMRPRPFPRASRSSVFGSLRSTSSLDDDERLTKTDSKTSLLGGEDDGPNIKESLFGAVLHHGEVQTASSMFRKRSQYLVLIESHLLRFKSQTKAAEVFPSISSTIGRSTGIRGSSTSIGSHQDMQAAIHTDLFQGIPLEQIVATYKIDDGRPYSSIEIAHLDEATKRPSSMQMSLSEPREAEKWLRAIRLATSAAKASLASRFQQGTVEHVARVLERERDYDPDHFQLFKVVQRISHRPSIRSSSEDLSKFNSSICYLAIGLHKVHLVPLSRVSGRSSSTSLPDVDSPTSFGIVTLSSVSLQSGEDTIHLVFQSPLKSPFAAHLASSEASQISLCLRYASEYLRPEWVRQPFVFNVPLELEDQMNPPVFPPDDHNCFDRTLIAYCAAYDLDTSRICYTVDYECEDAPCFRLLLGDEYPYSALELLAVFRALRYNESFGSIWLAGVDLNPLRHLYDPYGVDLDCMYTRSGVPTNIQGHQNLSILSQEIRALALKSKRLRSLDFSYCLPQMTKSHDEQPSCGIPEALVPLCKKSLTNVDWLVLNGIQLTETDLEYLVDAASERKCHLRGLELGECNLSVHDADVLLSTLAIQESTLEVIDISGVQGRFSPELFQRQIGCFPHIRRLNLTRVQKTAGPQPLIAPETLLSWRLQALHLSQTAMNEQAVDSLSAYLASSRSDTLHELYVNQCGLSGKDLAIFFRSMTRQRGQPRAMHVSASENRLNVGCSVLFQTISENYGPSDLTMRMMDFEKEIHFRELVEALANNSTLRKLDISKASLPYDAGDETCEALRQMFAQNQTLVELDISGDQAHLDATRFGIGLNLALRGLKNNTSLKVLKIEYQGLGIQGATTLAEVLEENTALIEIHCENNDLNLQSLTVLSNSLEKNQTLIYMSIPVRDRENAVEKTKRQLRNRDHGDEAHSPTKSGSLKRTFTGGFGVGVRNHRLTLKHTNTLASVVPVTDQEVTLAVKALNEKWDEQLEKMQSYLTRNYHLANGLPWDGETGRGERPTTAQTLKQALERLKLDQPVALNGEPDLDFVDEKLVEGKPFVPFTLPED